MTPQPQQASVHPWVDRFGEVVRRQREARGWSQERLAGRADLNRSYMGEVERGAVVPSLVTAAKLASALEVPLSELIQICEGRSGSALAAGLVAIAG